MLYCFLSIHLIMENKFWMKKKQKNSFLLKLLHIKKIFYLLKINSIQHVFKKLNINLFGFCIPWYTVAELMHKHPRLNEIVCQFQRLFKIDKPVSLAYNMQRRHCHLLVEIIENFMLCFATFASGRYYTTRVPAWLKPNKSSKEPFFSMNKSGSLDFIATET